MSLQMVQEVMSKGPGVFLEHFARLGVFSKVQALAGPSSTLLGSAEAPEEAPPAPLGPSLARPKDEAVRGPPYFFYAYPAGEYGLPRPLRRVPSTSKS